MVVKGCSTEQSMLANVADFPAKATSHGKRKPNTKKNESQPSPSAADGHDRLLYAKNRSRSMDRRAKSTGRATISTPTTASNKKKKILSTHNILGKNNKKNEPELGDEWKSHLPVRSKTPLGRSRSLGLNLSLVRSRSTGRAATQPTPKSVMRAKSSKGNPLARTRSTPVANKSTASTPTGCNTPTRSQALLQQSMMGGRKPQACDHAGAKPVTPISLARRMGGGTERPFESSRSQAPFGKRDRPTQLFGGSSQKSSSNKAADRVAKTKSPSKNNKQEQHAPQLFAHTRRLVDEEAESRRLQQHEIIVETVCSQQGAGGGSSSASSTLGLEPPRPSVQAAKTTLPAPSPGVVETPQPMENSWDPQVSPREPVAPSTTGGSGTKSLDPVESFRHAYKQDDKEEMIKQVITSPRTNWGISGMVSDLSCSSASQLDLVRSPKSAHRNKVLPSGKAETPQPRATMATTTQQLQQALEAAKNQVYPNLQFAKDWSASLMRTRGNGDEKAAPVSEIQTTPLVTPSIAPKPVMVVENDVADATKRIPSTGSSSPIDIRDGSDRYMMLTNDEETDDAFDAAARKRLGSKTAVVESNRAAITTTTTTRKPSTQRRPPRSQSSPRLRPPASTSTTPTRQRSKTPTSRSKTPTSISNSSRASNSVTSSTNRSQVVNLLGQRRSLHTNGQKRLLPTRRRKVTPGLALDGRSRSFADAVEDRLNAIQQKRQQDQHAPGVSSAAVTRTPRRWTSGKGNVDNSGRLSTSRSAAVQVPKRSSTKKLQKAGNAFFGARGRDKAVQGDAIKGKNYNLAPMDGKAQKGWFGRRRNEASSRNGTFESYNTNSVSSDHSIAGNNIPSLLKHMTTFDSLMKAAEEQDTANQAPSAEFGIVELGADEDTIKTHSILVNKGDIQGQILGTMDTTIENTSLVGNRKDRGLKSINELAATKRSKMHKFRHKEHVQDDSSIDNLEVTLSFANQLRQVQQPPVRVSKTGYEV